MNALFERPLEEHVLVRIFAVELVAQPVHRNGRDAALFVGVTEDKTLRGLVEIEIRNSEQQTAAAAILAQDFRRQGRQKELPARAVQAAARECERTFDDDIIEKTLRQTPS